MWNNFLSNFPSVFFEFHNYMNSTFYPKSVADVTVGTTTTKEQVYNPLKQCGCGSTVIF